MKVDSGPQGHVDVGICKLSDSLVFLLLYKSHKTTLQLENLCHCFSLNYHLHHWFHSNLKAERPVLSGAWFGNKEISGSAMFSDAFIILWSPFYFIHIHLIFILIIMSTYAFFMPWPNISPNLRQLQPSLYLVRVGYDLTIHLAWIGQGGLEFGQAQILIKLEPGFSSFGHATFDFAPWFKLVLRESIILIWI